MKFLGKKIENKKSSAQFKWAKFQVILNFDDDVFSIDLKNTLTGRKFRVVYADVPDPMKCCYGSLLQLYTDIVSITQSTDKDDLYRIKIQNNGKIIIFKKATSLDRRIKIGQLEVDQCFQILNTSGNSADSFSNKGQADNAKKVLEQQERISELQNQIFIQNKVLQNFINNSNRSISSFGESRHNRRKPFMKERLKLKQKIDNIYIKGFFCDFYLRQDRLEIFYVNSQNGDQFVVQIQDIASSQRIYKKIISFVEDQIIQQKITISKNGVLTIKNKQKIGSDKFLKYQQDHIGKIVECDSFQKIQKMIWLQKQLNQRKIDQKFDEFKMELTQDMSKIKNKLKNKLKQVKTEILENKNCLQDAHKESKTKTKQSKIC